MKTDNLIGIIIILGALLFGTALMFLVLEANHDFDLFKKDCAYQGGKAIIIHDHKLCLDKKTFIDVNKLP